MRRLPAGLGSLSARLRSMAISQSCAARSGDQACNSHTTPGPLLPVCTHPAPPAPPACQVRILATSDAALRQRMLAYQQGMTDTVLGKAARLEEKGWRDY